MFDKSVRIPMLEQRAHVLEQRDPVGNAKIIAKIRRELRKLQK